MADILVTDPGARRVLTGYASEYSLATAITMVDETAGRVATRAGWSIQNAVVKCFLEEHTL